MSSSSEKEKNDNNGNLDPVWLFEPPTADNNTQSLTDAGVENIANHKYKSGKYTYLDNKLNPMWTFLTELLPTWLAPNMVTLIGASHCGLSYFVTWYHSTNFDDDPKNYPDWAVFLSGCCSIMYYTFDCMDGKQARRTGSSSPLGQLFDHGFDCICNLAHVSNFAGYIGLGGNHSPYLFAVFQGSLFFSFFMAQWEEYYTGSLTHAMGDFGVTEVNYGLGLMAIINSFIDRDALYSTTFEEILPSSLSSIASHIIPGAVLELQLRHMAILAWCGTAFILVMGSFHRVLNNEYVLKNQLGATAVSKLLSPFLIAIFPFILPYQILSNETRSISIIVGLLISYLTMKMICFSMAKQSYACIQLDAIPYWFVLICIRFDYNDMYYDYDDTQTLTIRNSKIVLKLLCVYYVYKLSSWSKSAITQICERLDIYCLSIKHQQQQQQQQKKD